MSRPNQTTPAGEGFPVGFERFNIPGNNLFRIEGGSYVVLNANNTVVAFGPQLAPLWEYAVRRSTVKPFSTTEQAAIATIGSLPVQKVKTTAVPQLSIKKSPIQQKAASQEAPWKKPAPPIAIAPVPQRKAEAKKVEPKKTGPKRTEQAVAKKVAKKTPLTPVQKNGKQKKQPLAKVVQMVGKMVGNEIEVGMKAIDRFVRNYMGQRDPAEIRLSEPTPVRYAYVDPQWISDRQHPQGIATKISSR